MLSIVCWRWKPRAGYRSTFGPQTVNTLRAMVERHYQKPHRFICVTDDPRGIDPRVEIVPLWTDYSNLQSPYGSMYPSCYRRLKMFSPEAAQWFGERFVSIDLDVVVTGDLAPIFDRTEDIVLLGDTNPKTHYNGSLILMRAGSRPKVWDEFDPVKSPAMTRRAGFMGSDQAWISACLGPGEAKFTKRDGVYSYRNHIAPNGGRLPLDARLTIWHGAHDPWGPVAQRLSWVRKFYAVGPLHSELLVGS